jgi:hypothetical protein
MTCYSDANEMIRLEVFDRPEIETLTALATFCRQSGFGHVYAEMLQPAMASSTFLLSMGLTDRPWPPQGIGSQRVEAVATALVDTTGRAFLTPALLGLGHSTNVGLAACVTKKLYEALRERNVSRIYYLVRDEEHVLDRVLRRAGFLPGDFRAATEQAEYVEYSAAPAEALAALGLNDIRLGDVLNLTMDGDQLDRVVGFHIALGAAIRPVLTEQATVAPLLPGLVHWIVMSPPGGIGGTPGPSRKGVRAPKPVRRPRQEADNVV